MPRTRSAPRKPARKRSRAIAEPRDAIISDTTDYLRVAYASGDQLGKRPPTGEIPDIPISVWTDWSVRQIKGACTDLVQGTFGQAALLSEAMLADDRIQSAVNGRTKGVTTCDALLEAPKESGQQGKDVAAELTYLWEDIFPVELLEQLEQWTIFLSFCLVEKIWEPKKYKGEQRWIPRLKVWHPLYIYYRIDIRRFVAITLQGQIEIDPDDPRWFLFTPYGSYRGWMRGAVRSVSIPWVVRQFALRDWARFSEVHGLPIKIAKVPAQSSAEDKARFFNSIRNLGAETGVQVPVQSGKDAASFDLSLLEATDRSWQAFPGLIQQCDSSITLAIRGVNLTTQVQGGSYAASQTHREEGYDYAISDRRKLATAIKRYVLDQYCAYNFGSADLSPTVKFVPDEATTEDEAKVIFELAQAYTVFEQSGWPIDRVKVAEKYGIPLLEQGQETVGDKAPQKAAQPNAATPPKPKPSEPENDNDDQLEAAE